MAWPCSMLAVVAVVFSGCFQHSVGQPPSVTTRVQSRCQTPACYALEAMIMEKLNLSADPCEDFSEYACGRFNKEHVLPNGTALSSSFKIIGIDNAVIIKDILTNETNHNQPSYLVKMRQFYKSCLNETQIEFLGVTPYLNDRAFVDDWPTLNPHWSEAGFDLNEVIARYTGVAIYPIFYVWTGADFRNSSRYQITLTQPDLGLTQSEFLEPRNNSIIMAYEIYLAETAIALNVSRDVAERDARDVVDLEIELAKLQITVPTEQLRDVTVQINPVNLSQFSVLYPRLDIARAIRATYSAVNITLPDDEVVNNLFPAYLENVTSVLDRFPKRTIQNLFGFKYAERNLDSLTRRLREVSMDYRKVRWGIQTEEPRWAYCVYWTATFFQQGMSKQFVNRVFSRAAKRSTLFMIGAMKRLFRKMIRKATWMSNATKDETLEKLAAMKSKIGYPDADFNESDIERRYENYTMSEDNYYSNYVLSDRLDEQRKLALLRKPVDHNTWHTAPYEVNAYAAGTENAIVFPAGIMRPPFFSESFPSYVNYGAMGSIIGHEISHLFDDNGALYDINGNLRNWWTTEDQDNFRNRSQCIIDQYNNFYIDEINMTLNGEKTRGENVGDTSGLKMSFKVYKQRVERKGNPERLPTLDLSPDQLFFLAFGQVWCEKSTREALIMQAESSQHSPGKYRIIGALQNSKPFARAYNCPRGSYMNPRRKCNVW